MHGSSEARTDTAGASILRLKMTSSLRLTNALRLRQMSPWAHQRAVHPRLWSTSTAQSFGHRENDTGAGSSSDSTHFGFREVPLGEKESMVGEVFHSVASSYDIMNDVMSAGVHRLWKDWFVDELGPMRARPGQPSARVLDVAGGTGDIARRILQFARNTEQGRGSGADQARTALCGMPHVTVCDINKSMLAEGRERAAVDFKEFEQHLDWVHGNAEQLPFEDNSFEVYTIAFGIRNVTDVPKALAEAHRVLVRGGRFLCLEFSQVPNPVLRRLYDAYSFNVIPKMGAAVAGDQDSYQYLVESIRRFPPQEEFRRMLRHAGFAQPRYENYTEGVVAVHSGFKL